MPNTLHKLRNAAYSTQQGRCYYCQVPMWLYVPEELTESLDLTHGEAAKLQCTAEHLRPRSEGGGETSNNIVAACLHCNGVRHKRKVPPAPDKYLSDVRRRVQRGKWHPRKVNRLSK
jgi:hypothetical protein